MREIRFRAWDLDNGGMWYSDRDCSDGEWGKNWVIDRQGIHFEEMALDNLIEGGEAVQRERWHTPKQVVMQYTGLKDKNGGEIYEGDILRRDFHGSDWVVEFNDGSFIARQPKDLNRTHEIFMCDLELGSSKVIGNIHENPELLAPAPEKEG